MEVLLISRGLPQEKYPLFGIFELDQAKALVSQGIQVTFFAVDIRSLRRKRKWGISHENRDGVDCYTISVPVGAVPLGIKSFLAEKALNILYKHVYAKRRKPDLIHAHFIFQGYIAQKLAEKLNIPLVITEHSSDMNYEKLSVNNIRMGTAVYPRAARVITVGKPLAENIKKNFAVECKVIPNIVDTSVFHCAEHTNDVFVFVSVGAVSERKNMLGLIAAFAKFHKIHPDSCLRIAGDGEQMKDAKALISELQLQGCIEMKGYQSRQAISGLFDQADAFVLLSRTETFGVVYIEAMAAGLPVIATRCGGPEDFVNETNGLLIGHTEEEAVQAMCEMYEQYSRYDRQSISDETHRKFSGRQIAAQIIEAYHDILKKQPEAEKEAI